MSTIPVSVPVWDSTLTHVVAITGGHASTGFVNNEIPGSGELNTVLNLNGQWAQYMNDGVWSQAIHLTSTLTVDGRAEREIFVPVPEFISAGTDFSGTVKSLEIPPLPVGSKITTIATSTKGDGAFNQGITVSKASATTGSTSTIFVSTPAPESNSYHVTAALTCNVTTATAEAFSINWAAVTTQNLRGFVVKYIPPAAL